MEDSGLIGYTERDGGDVVTEQGSHLIERLVGPATERDLRFIDYALSDRFGVFVPATGPCDYSITVDHVHPAYMILVNLHSRCKVRIGDHVVESAPNRLYFLSPDIKHHEILEEGFNRYYACLIERDFFERCAAPYTDDVPVFLCDDFAIPESLVTYLVEYMAEYERKDGVSQAQMALLEERIAHVIARAAFEDATTESSLPFTGVVDRAIHFMNVRFGSELALEDIAAFVSVSPSHFLRLFKRATGKTPMEYLRAVRLEKARKLLARTYDTVTRIALDSGFGSASYFSTAFLAEYGENPSEYRKGNAIRERLG